jgi:hypothetical protein
MASRFGLEGAREVGRGGEAAWPLLDGEQLGRAAGGEPAVLDQPVAHASMTERKGEGRVGRRGGEGRWKHAGERRGKGGRWGWLGQRPSGLVRLAGPKARNE